MPIESGPTRVVEAADLADVVLTLARRMYGWEGRRAGIEHLGAVDTLVMRHVDRHPGVTPSEVAEAVGLKASNTSTSLRGLESRGLVERRRDTADARQVRVFPTDKAAANLARLRELWSDMLTPHIPDGADVAATVALLESVNEALADPK
ncbi:MarR family winged helix-turn-helix transcriptional regulator [Demequina pelophila]|uniref:MarR family winged helix-turn-helix transcriptional regulator n=1 Tax=Demequina pelophila TaxID=1638984 RepID=UPI000785C9C8|nr:MarR family transcriptional regulator [Demequina pelophila]